MLTRGCRGLIVGALLGALVVALPASAPGNFPLPPLPPPEIYGNILIDRSATKQGVKPVVFSHWRHRLNFTCRVCHGELEFNYSTNSTEITEAAIRQGRFCGACHNGRIVFAPNKNCGRCHSGDLRQGSKDFALVLPENIVPKAPFGNKIDWSAAMRRRIIAPNAYLLQIPREMPFFRELYLEAEWGNIPPAIFPHRDHTAWLDCAACHPQPFNIKKKTTKHFAMAYILKGEFCGVCHLRVAFPMDDCKRCHPGMRS